MSGTPITLQQVKLYTSYRNKSSQVDAAAKAGISERTRSVNYKHVIHSLAKKPNAFKSSQLRDDLIPEGDFTLLWKDLTKENVTDKDCHYMVELRLLAHNCDCEMALSRYVLDRFHNGNRASIDHCKNVFGSCSIDIPIIMSQQHQINSYDSLLGALNG